VTPVKIKADRYQNHASCIGRWILIDGLLQAAAKREGYPPAKDRGRSRYLMIAVICFETGQYNI